MSLPFGLRVVPLLYATILGGLLGCGGAYWVADRYAEHNYHHERRAYSTFLEEVVRPRLVKEPETVQFINFGGLSSDEGPVRAPKPAMCKNAPVQGAVHIGDNCQVRQ